jgi:hypothetical protein
MADIKMVWVVEGGWDYEGSEICAICATPEKASEKEQEAKLSRMQYDFVDVTAHVVK